MVRRCHMPGEKDIISPWKVLRILRASDEEFLSEQLPCWFDKQSFQRSLTVFRVSPKIREIALKHFHRCGGLVHFRVHTAIERNDATRAEFGLKLFQRCSTRVA